MLESSDALLALAMPGACLLPMMSLLDIEIAPLLDMCSAACCWNCCCWRALGGLGLLPPACSLAHPRTVNAGPTASVDLIGSACARAVCFKCRIVIPLEVAQWSGGEASCKVHW